MAGRRKKRAPCKTPECRERRRKAEARRKAFRQKRKSEAFLKPKRRKPGTTPKAKARKAKKARKAQRVPSESEVLSQPIVRRKKTRSKFFALHCSLGWTPSECIAEWDGASSFSSFTAARKEAMSVGDDVDDDRYGLVVDSEKRVIYMPEYVEFD